MLGARTFTLEASRCPAKWDQTGADKSALDSDRQRSLAGAGAWAGNFSGPGGGLDKPRARAVGKHETRAACRQPVFCIRFLDSPNRLYYIFYLQYSIHSPEFVLVTIYEYPPF